MKGKHDLQSSISEAEWDRMNNVMDISANIAVRVSYYKVRHVAHLGVLLISDKILARNSFREITIKIKFLFSPECYLLHLFLNLDRVAIVLLNNLLMAAKIVIARWKTDDVPTVQEWQVFCQYLCLMHKLTAVKKLRNGSEIALVSFFTVWSKFLKYWNFVKPQYNVRQEVLKLL